MKNPLKILIIRFSSIGDIVLTTPVIRCLKLQKKAEIHYLTKSSYASILKTNPHINKVWTLEKKVVEVIPDLKKEKFDYIIDLHKNLRSWQIKHALRIPTRSFDKINIPKWLMVNFKINRLPDVHIVNRYMATTQTFGVHNDGQGLDYFIPKKDEVQLKDFFLKQASTSTFHLYKNTQLYIAFAIGAAHQTKRLPTEKIIDICKKIKLPIILLGGKGEAVEGEEIVQKAGEHILNACGKINLHQSASIVQQAWKVITHDTGMMHIAAAFQKDIISVWGNTIPAFGMYPYYKKGVRNNITVEVKGLSCRPCSKIGYKKCPKGHFKCMEDIEFPFIHINS